MPHFLSNFEVHCHFSAFLQTAGPSKLERKQIWISRVDLERNFKCVFHRTNILSEFLQSISCLKVATRDFTTSATIFKISKTKRLFFDACANLYVTREKAVCEGSEGRQWGYYILDDYIIDLMFSYKLMYFYLKRNTCRP